MTISYNFPKNLVSFDIFCPLHTDIKGARTTLHLHLLGRLSILKSIFMLYLCEHNLGILVTVSVFYRDQYYLVEVAGLLFCPLGTHCVSRAT